MSNTTISIQAAKPHSHDHDGEHVCMSRRHMLLTGGATVALITLGGLPGMAEAAQALKASYPRQKIGSLAALKTGVPVSFNYPYPDIRNVLVKLGVPAGAGLGAEKGHRGL
jgi:hypothetical protein